MAVRKVAFIIVAFMMISIAPARQVPAHLSFEHRLKFSLGEKAGDGSGVMDCWGSLLELRACTDEILLLFLNREGYIGPDCCRAIRVITHQCWPDMLASVGFTAKEGDILLDYCDAPPPLSRLVTSISAPAPAPAK